MGRCVARSVMWKALLLAAAAGIAGCASTGTTAAKPVVPEERHFEVDVGSVAPDFTLPDVHPNAGTVTLSKVYKNKPVLLVYYMGYSCPRCVAHLEEFARIKKEFDALDVQILAVSPDKVQDAQESINTYGDFPFPVLSDPDEKVAGDYGLRYGETLFHGLYVIDTNGRVALAMKSSHPYDDTDKILQMFKLIKAAK